MSPHIYEPTPKDKSHARAAGAVAWFGLFLFGPLALVGMIWGRRIYARTDGWAGGHAQAVGMLGVVLWGLWLLIRVATALAPAEL